MERAVEIFAAVNFLVVGLSHVLHPKVWAGFFMRLAIRGAPGVWIPAFLSLGFGSLIVAFHNVWSGIPLILTLYGWSQVLKALLYFAAPRVGLRVLQRVREDRAGEFRIAGYLLFLLGGLLVVHIATT
jgi:hypothetical protein